MLSRKLESLTLFLVQCGIAHMLAFLFSVFLQGEVDCMLCVALCVRSRWTDVNVTVLATELAPFTLISFDRGRVNM